MAGAEIYWPYVAIATGAVVAIPMLYFLAQRRWTWLALVVALANLTIVLMNGAAPIRGLLDPDYVGFGFGFLTADKGIAVTIAAGALVVISAISCWLAARNRPGATMLVVAATCAFHIVNLGFPLMDTMRAKPEDMTIQFGEYLTVPYQIAIPAIVVLLILPFLLGLPWALRRAFATD
jgi:hypothetical protein